MKIIDNFYVHPVCTLKFGGSRAARFLSFSVRKGFKGQAVGLSGGLANFDGSRCTLQTFFLKKIFVIVVGNTFFCQMVSFRIFQVD